MQSAISGSIDACVPVGYEPRTRLTRLDLLLALLLGLLAAAISLGASGRFDPGIYDKRNVEVWFDADPHKALGAMTDPDSRWHRRRTAVHPLFSLINTPIVSALTALGVEPLEAGRGMIAACALLTVAFLLLALRGLGLPRAVGLLFTGVFLASATYIHWFCVVEVHALAAPAMSFALFVLTTAAGQRSWAWFVASVATLATTTTNWTLALAGALCRVGLRRTLAIAAAALVSVVLLAAVQKVVYPMATWFFLPGIAIRELRFTPIGLGRRKWTPISNVWSVAITSAVTPAPRVATKTDTPVVTRYVSNQHSPLSSHSPAGWIALGAWLVLLAGGALGGWANVERRAVFVAISLFLAGQLALHAFYGTLTFLYSPNVFAALVLFTAFGWFSRIRVPALLAAAMFVVFGRLSNVEQFNAAVELSRALLQR